ncbi:MAG TPA: DUF4097 family beta strand repeat-containing protein, partial [bacterium]|nr:DUF4097 family beta strand repeat-containing protein [bacterium]
FFNFGGWGDGDISLKIPQEKSLELNLKSGDISFSDYKGNDIVLRMRDIYRIRGASGDISVSRIVCKNFSAHLTSGDVDIDIETKRGNINCRSGDVTVNLRGEEWDVDISGVSGDVDVNTESGSIDLYISGISGDVTLNDKSIGEGKIGKKHLTIDGGRNKLNINVISGDISIKTAKEVGESSFSQVTTLTEPSESFLQERDTAAQYIPEEVKKVKEMYKSGKISKEDAIGLIEAMGYGGLNNILEE